MTMIVEEVGSAPNPQFVRDGWTDLTGAWAFAYDDADVGLAERWFQDPEKLDRTIQVPYPPESGLSGIGDTSYHRVLWYARTFLVESGTETNTLLHFGAVDYRATVWVDGVWAGAHEGGHTPFTVDVTTALAAGKTEHTVVVRVEDDPIDDEQPRGKQEWLEQPHIIWYHRTSGIWQPVWLESAPAVHFEGMHWTFDRARWRIDFDITLSGRAVPETTLRVDFEHESVALPSGTFAVHGDRVSGSIGIDSSYPTMNWNVLLWRPATPNLIGVKLTLSAPDAVDDVVKTYIGLRTIDTSTPLFRINGKAHFLRLVLNQGYWPESQLTAPSPEALKREVELILELGFNGARNHQKIEDPRFLYWADRLGLLLWAEMPSPFASTELALARHAAEWREAIVRDRNHPCVIAWVPFNESWGISDAEFSPRQQHAVKAVYHTTHELDGTRPVIGNDGWEQVEGDVFTIHDYTWNPETLRRRYETPEAIRTSLEMYFPGDRRLAVAGYRHEGKPVLISEYGGVSYVPDSGSEWFGYGKVTTEEEFLAQYEALTSVLHHIPGLAGFCYTQLCDTEQETNGLLDEHRVPKANLDELRRITRGHGDRDR
ncbi:MAG TPA: glycoside hydrolase family 2 TIM barrel-domain containing protein [Thermomicrobiales bacterium]|nr:glycoside hydrolase family 2 TIM barrel-domain containing protein [Thermomicrobiales bacterium]